MNEVAVVGGGLAGAAAAIRLLERGAAVALIDRDGAFGRGLAYSTTCDRHRLNVRSARMSLFEERPDDFAGWLAEHVPADADPDGFARRSVFGRYVGERLEAAERAAPGRLTRVRTAAVGLRREGADFAVRLADGSERKAGGVVLATGNAAPAPPRIAGLDEVGDRFRPDPWAEGAISGVGPDEDVVLIGTGLTAVDVLLALQAQGWRGRARALSRRGLLPRSHAPRPGPRSEPSEPVAGLAGRLGAFRREARAAPWRDLMDGLRPHGQRLWLEAGDAERRRFLRHLRPWWDVHRHRMAPEIAEEIESLERSGRLTVAAARLSRVSAAGDRLEVAFRPRGGAVVTIAADRVFNCTGPDPDPARSQDPLWRSLFREGRVRADAYGLGIDVGPDLRAIGADGAPTDGLYALGPLVRGVLWETVAVPEIRVQAADVARALRPA